MSWTEGVVMRLGGRQGCYLMGAISVPCSKESGLSPEAFRGGLGQWEGRSDLHFGKAPLAAGLRVSGKGR